MIIKLLNIIKVNKYNKIEIVDDILN